MKNVIVLEKSEATTWLTAVSEQQTDNVLVTPEVAEAWLERNEANVRDVQQTRVDELVRAIQRGAWRLTHQGLAFDRAGRLLDGQHRLTAIFLGSTPCVVAVARAVDPAGLGVMDCGSPRSLNVRLRGRLDAPTLKRAYATVERSLVQGYRGGVMGESDLLAFAARVGPSLAWVLDVIAAKRERLHIATVWGALVFAHAIPSERASVEAFGESLRSGANLDGDSPVLRLREHILGAAFPDPFDTMCRTLSALRLYATGKRCARLQANGSAVAYYVDRRPDAAAAWKKAAAPVTSDAVRQRVLGAIRAHALRTADAVQRAAVGRRAEVLAVLRGLLADGTVARDRNGTYRATSVEA